MTGTDDPRDAELEKTTNKLSAGLKSCRVVVDSYRAMLSGDARLPAGKDDLPDNATQHG